MSAVDMALRQAQQQGANAWRILETAMSGEVVTASEWQGLLEQALDEGLFRLQQQPVFACRSRGLMHRELFLRLPDPRQAGEVIPAGVFMPMAESRRMSTRIDRWVIQAVVERVAARLGMDRIAINLPPASLAEEGFLDWLAGYLQAHPECARRLILEWPEYGASAHLAELKQWIERLAPLGVEFSLDPSAPLPRSVS